MAGTAGSRPTEDAVRLEQEEALRPFDQVEAVIMELSMPLRPSTTSQPNTTTTRLSVADRQDHDDEPQAALGRRQPGEE